jgi:hypothetical protein
VPLSLRGNESAVLAFDSGNVLGGSAGLHVTAAANADAFYDSTGGLAIKVPSNGQYRVALSNGSVKDVKVDAVPAALKLGNWKLKVEDWKPSDTPTTTSKTVIAVDLGDLKPWKNVPELQSSSGIGTYTTMFAMNKGWKDGVGAVLDLGIVNFGYKLTVNGVEVKAKQTNTAIDIGPYLKAGNNTVEVEVATTLNNRLKALYNVAARTVDSYGLIGSGGTSATDGLGGAVRVTPYVVTAIR